MFNNNNEVAKVTGTHWCSSEKFPDLHPMVPFVDVMLDDDDSRPPKITLKVRIDPSLGDEHSNLMKEGGEARRLAWTVFTV
jgi:hypothetical protein